MHYTRVGDWPVTHG